MLWNGHDGVLDVTAEVLGLVLELGDHHGRDVGEVELLDCTIRGLHLDARPVIASCTDLVRTTLDGSLHYAPLVIVVSPVKKLMVLSINY